MNKDSVVKSFKSIATKILGKLKDMKRDSQLKKIQSNQDTIVGAIEYLNKINKNQKRMNTKLDTLMEMISELELSAPSGEKAEIVDKVKKTVSAVKSSTPEFIPQIDTSALKKSERKSKSKSVKVDMTAQPGKEE